MKKILISLTVLILVLIIVLDIFIGKIEQDITDEDLPQDIYENNGDLLLISQQTLAEFLNPFSLEDEYTLTEEFLNYMLLDSIRSNVNEDYDPLNTECVESECDTIVETSFGNVEYAFVKLNDDNQIVVVVNFNRSTYPKVETAVYATFDVDVDLTQATIVLTLDKILLNEMEISKSNLDFILGFFDPDAIEDMISLGELDLEAYTYSVSLLP